MDRKLTKAEQSEQTREAILQAARKLFFTVDYNTISTQMIAEEASKIAKTNKFYRDTVSKASIFNHFDSKENLALILFESISQDMIKEFESLDDGSSVEEYLEKIVRYSLNFMIEHPNVMQFFLQMTNELTKGGNQELWENVGKLFEGYILSFVEKFNQLGIRNPIIKARILFAALDGLGLHLYLDTLSGAQLDIEPFVEEFMSLIKNWITQGEQHE